MGNSRTEFNKVSKKLIEEVGKCELCGSKRNLEVHHIIPRCAKFPGLDINLDDEDNLIVVCGACHSRLTPRRMLTKYGIQAMSGRTGIYALYRRIQDEDCYVSVSDVLDMVEEIWG